MKPAGYLPACPFGPVRRRRLDNAGSAYRRDQYSEPELLSVRLYSAADMEPIDGDFATGSAAI